MSSSKCRLHSGPCLRNQNKSPKIHEVMLCKLPRKGAERGNNYVALDWDLVRMPIKDNLRLSDVISFIFQTIARERRLAGFCTCSHGASVYSDTPVSWWLLTAF